MKVGGSLTIGWCGFACDGCVSLSFGGGAGAGDDGGSPDDVGDWGGDMNGVSVSSFFLNTSRRGIGSDWNMCSNLGFRGKGVKYLQDDGRHVQRVPIVRKTMRRKWLIPFAGM